MKVAKTDTLVELHIPDFEKAKNFYAKLGFQVVWEREPEGYKGLLIIKRGDSILYFWGGNEQVMDQPYFGNFPKTTKRGYGVEIVIMTEQIEAIYEEAKKFAIIVEELKLKPWGIKDFRIEDPFGFYLKITEAYDILDKNIALP